MSEVHDPSVAQQTRAERISLLTALPILASAVVSGLVGHGAPIAGVGGLSLLFTLLALSRHERPRSLLPTVVTCFRALITCVMSAIGHRFDAPWVGLTVLTVFTLDGIDGYLARRMNATSVLGARIDLETDALLVVVTCTQLFLRGLGPWVMTGALLRYAYVLFVHFFAAHGEVPRLRLFRYAFGISIAGFVSGFFTHGFTQRLGPLLATSMLSYSFGHAFYWSVYGRTLRMSQSNNTSEPSE